MRILILFYSMDHCYYNFTIFKSWKSLISNSEVNINRYVVPPLDQISCYWEDREVDYQFKRICYTLFVIE